MIAPSQASVDLVTSYLIEKGVQADKITLNPSRDFMNVWMSVYPRWDSFPGVNRVKVILLSKFILDR